MQRLYDVPDVIAVWADTQIRTLQSRLSCQSNQSWFRQYIISCYKKGTTKQYNDFKFYP